MKITAGRVMNLLAVRHSDDVFVAECTAKPKSFRMDAWAMRTSYSRPAIWGYEVKVSRRDFVQDNKWSEYMDHCNEFYFVSPSGVIDPSEVPEEAGLIWVAQTGTRLYTKKKAPRRKVKIPEQFWRYLVMKGWSTPRQMDYDDAREYWRKWLENRELDWRFGHHVSKAIAETVEKEVTKVARENKHLKHENAQYESIKGMLEEMGLSVSDSSWHVRQKLDEIRSGVDKEMKRKVESALRSLQGMMEVINEIENRGRGHDVRG